MAETEELEVLAETVAQEPAEDPEPETLAENPPAATMKVVGLQEVEVKHWHGDAANRVFGWHRMHVTDALRLQDDTFRCPECLGRVRLRRASAEKNYGDHAEHYSQNPGCSLGTKFTGEKKLHTKPLN